MIVGHLEAADAEREIPPWIQSLIDHYWLLRDELDENTGVINALRRQRDKAEEERRFYQEMFKDTTEHMAAVHAALDLSYEAETPFVLAAIRKLRNEGQESVLDPPRFDGKARGVSTAYARAHPDGPPDFDG